MCLAERRAGSFPRQDALVVADALAAAGSFIFAFHSAKVWPCCGRAFGVERRVCAVRRAARIVVGIRLLSFRYCDLYRLRGEFSFVDDGIRIFKATAIGTRVDRRSGVSVSRRFEFRAFSYARRVRGGLRVCAAERRTAQVVHPFGADVRAAGRST